MTNTKIHKLDFPKCMIDGEKFVKWDEDGMVGTPVTLKIDRYGFYLHWADQNSESDLLDLALLRDTRTGKYAKIPKDPKLRQLVNIGSSADSLEEKTVTLVFGTDYVNLTFINFCCTKKEVAKLWTDELMKLICNRVQANASALTFLLKAYTKLTLLPDRSGKIPVKNVFKMFTQNKEERKKIERALELSGHNCGKTDVLNLANFTFEHFLTFYQNLVLRTEVEKIFENLCASCGEQNRKFMSITQFVNFINKVQRDPRLNEILYPYANASRAKDLIEEHEPDRKYAERGQLSFDGFLRYLMSEDNPIMTSSKLDLSEDMDQPLAHYFINSSHNTYLSGHQLTGKSSVEMYRQCLLAGCRCVELDFWNGKTDEPVIVHGYTFVPEIPARDVIEAIAESAFKTSEYPVVLSFENHCNPRQQAKIAQYCREFFGEMLLDAPLESHKLEPGVALPPPSLLKYKIIIKNKKKHHHHHHHHHHHRNTQKKTTTPSASTELEAPAPAPTPVVVSNGSPNSIGNGEVKQHPSPVRQGSKDSSQDNEDDDDDDDESSTGMEDEDDESTGAEEIKLQMQGKPAADKVSSRKETEAGAEISALVNYVQPIHFISFENAEKKGRCYEMSSFDEKQATTLLKERPIEFVNYNKNQLSRVYPAGTRFDSSNFMPQVFWNAGCQLVAINYQTLDLAMQLNLGIFEYNARCGYLLKPEFLRRRDRCLDPFAESTVDGIIAGSVTIHVLSGQFLSDKRVGTYVEVDMFGLPADTVRKKFRTKIVPNNGINPVYDDEPFVFKKVVLPDLASLRIAAYEDSGKLIGHRVLTVVGLCPGYRHVGLRNESGQPLPLATLFLNVVVKDYVPDGLSDFAEALANPIKFQSDLERRSTQLAVLMDDDAPTADSSQTATGDDATSKPTKKHQPSFPDLAVTNTLVPVPRIPITPSLFPSSSDASDDTENTTKLSTSSPSVEGSSCKTSPKIIPPSSPSLNDELEAETLEKLMENKAVKEKKAELEKKLEMLKKKFEKERNRMTGTKSGTETDRSRSKFSVSNRLVKRLSIKSIDNIATSLAHITQEVPEGETDTDTSAAPHYKFSRSQSEKLLTASRDFIQQEKDLKDKYHDIIFNCIDKLMRTSQSNQMKTLRVLLEKETDAVMRRLEANRREEVKTLSKKHKDKDEMTRIKREVSSSMVERGVNERMRLTQIYEKRKEELEKHHQEVRQQIEEEKSRAKAAIQHEYDEKLRNLEEKYKIILEDDGGAKDAA